MFSQRLKNKIDFITELTCYDHHKTRDTIYSVEYSYYADDGDSWYPHHDGYLWSTEDREFFKINFKSFDEAASALEKAIDEQVEIELSYFDDQYFEEIDEKNSWILPHPQISSLEDVQKMRDKWNAICEL